MQYITKCGDNIDLICYKIYGSTIDKVELVYAANPGLCELAIVFNAGITIELPEITTTSTAITKTQKLWD